MRSASEAWYPRERTVHSIATSHLEESARRKYYHFHSFCSGTEIDAFRKLTISRQRMRWFSLFLVAIAWTSIVPYSWTLTGMPMARFKYVPSSNTKSLYVRMSGTRLLPNGELWFGPCHLFLIRRVSTCRSNRFVSIDDRNQDATVSRWSRWTAAPAFRWS